MTSTKLDICKAITKDETPMAQKFSLDKVLERLHSDQEHYVTNALIWLRKSFLHHAGAPEKLVRRGALPRLLSLIATDNRKWCDVSLSILGNLAQTGDQTRLQIMRLDGIRSLVTLLKQSGDESVQNRVCRTLANLAQNPLCAQAIHADGVLEDAPLKDESLCVDNSKANPGQRTPASRKSMGTGATNVEHQTPSHNRQQRQANSGSHNSRSSGSQGLSDREGIGQKTGNSHKPASAHGDTRGKSHTSGNSDKPLQSHTPRQRHTLQTSHTPRQSHAHRTPRTSHTPGHRQTGNGDTSKEQSTPSFVEECAKQPVTPQPSVTSVAMNVDPGSSGSHGDVSVLERVVKLLASSQSSDCQQTFIRTLRLLGNTEDHRSAILECRGLRAILTCLTSPDDDVIMAAIKAAAQFMRNTSCDPAMWQFEEAQGGRELLSLAQEHKQTPVCTAAASLLLALSKNEFLRPSLGNAGVIDFLIKQIESDVIQTEDKLAYINALCLYSSESVNRVKIRQAGGLPLLLKFLKDPDYLPLHYRIVSALSCFAYDEAGMRILLHGGLVSIFLGVLRKCKGIDDVSLEDVFVQSVHANTDTDRGETEIVEESFDYESSEEEVDELCTEEDDLLDDKTSLEALGDNGEDCCSNNTQANNITGGKHEGGESIDAQTSKMIVNVREQSMSSREMLVSKADDFKFDESSYKNINPSVNTSSPSTPEVRMTQSVVDYHSDHALVSDNGDSKYGPKYSIGSPSYRNLNEDETLLGPSNIFEISTEVCMRSPGSSRSNSPAFNSDDGWSQTSNSPYRSPSWSMQNSPAGNEMYHSPVHSEPYSPIPNPFDLEESYVNEFNNTQEKSENNISNVTSSVMLEKTLHSNEVENMSSFVDSVPSSYHKDAKSSSLSSLNTKNIENDSFRSKLESSSGDSTAMNEKDTLENSSSMDCNHYEWNVKNKTVMYIQQRDSHHNNVSLEQQRKRRRSEHGRRTDNDLQPVNTDVQIAKKAKLENEPLSNSHIIHPTTGMKVEISNDLIGGKKKGVQRIASCKVNSDKQRPSNPSKETGSKYNLPFSPLPKEGNRAENPDSCSGDKQRSAKRTDSKSTSNQNISTQRTSTSNKLRSKLATSAKGANSLSTGAQGISTHSSSNKNTSREGTSTQGGNNQDTSNHVTSNQGPSNHGASNQGTNNRGTSAKGTGTPSANTQKLPSSKDSTTRATECCVLRMLLHLSYSDSPSTDLLTAAILKNLIRYMLCTKHPLRESIKLLQRLCMRASNMEGVIRGHVMVLLHLGSFSTTIGGRWCGKVLSALRKHVAGSELMRKELARAVRHDGDPAYKGAAALALVFCYSEDRERLDTSLAQGGLTALLDYIEQSAATDHKALVYCVHALYILNIHEGMVTPEGFLKRPCRRTLEAFRRAREGVVFEVDSRPVPADRALVTQLSPVLNALLEGGFAEGGQSRVTVRDTSHAAMSLLMDLLHGDLKVTDLQGTDSHTNDLHRGRNDLEVADNRTGDLQNCTKQPTKICGNREFAVANSASAICTLYNGLPHFEKETNSTSSGTDKINDISCNSESKSQCRCVVKCKTQTGVKNAAKLYIDGESLVLPGSATKRDVNHVPSCLHSYECVSECRSKCDNKCTTKPQSKSRSISKSVCQGAATGCLDGPSRCHDYPSDNPPSCLDYPTDYPPGCPDYPPDYPFGCPDYPPGCPNYPPDYPFGCPDYPSDCPPGCYAARRVLFAVLELCRRFLLDDVTSDVTRLLVPLLHSPAHVIQALRLAAVQDWSLLAAQCVTQLTSQQFSLRTRVACFKHLLTGAHAPAVMAALQRALTSSTC